MRIHAASIASGAFLLFLVQPLIARYLLPWFGGGSSVWTACMLFFQVGLLGGYLYAHWSVRHLAPRAQAVLHGMLLLGSLALLPIEPAAHWRPEPGDDATLGILTLLLANLGLPYLVLAATAPLLQAWLAAPGRAAALRDPKQLYRLYALSNAAALIALIGYPFVIDPLLGRYAQTIAWSTGFVIFAAFTGACAWNRYLSAAVIPKAETAPVTAPVRRMRLSKRLMWLALPCCGSVTLLAVTDHLTQDVSPVPFLWVLPLAIYLLSFVIAFDRERWYSRRFYVALLLLAEAAAAAVLGFNVELGLFAQVAVFGMLLFAICMICHGELHRLRPPVRALTSFYTSIAAGGALGGLLVAVAAPLAFDAYLELPLAMIGVLMLLAVVMQLDPHSALHGRHAEIRWAGMIVAVLALWLPLYRYAGADAETTLVRARNFYGVLEIHEDAQVPYEARKRGLWHGNIVHGTQHMALRHRRTPTSYYSTTSGIGRLFADMRGRSNLRVGVIGLGAGTLATYGKEGDRFHFYEINPQVVRFARERFSFLKDSFAESRIRIGDARVVLEEEEAKNFDLLVVDAFSGDSVPMHLLTAEAFELYRRHMAEDGVIAVHVTNRHLDLQPVIGALAARMGQQAVSVHDDQGPYASDWVLVSKGGAWLTGPRLEEIARPTPVGGPALTWTDDRADLLHALQ